MGLPVMKNVEKKEVNSLLIKAKKLTVIFIASRKTAVIFNSKLFQENSKW